MVDGTPGARFIFEQKAVATIPNQADGSPPWTIELSVWGTSGIDETGGFILVVHQDLATYRYEGTAVATLLALENGGYRYVYSAAYGLTSAIDEEEPPAVMDGTFALTVDTLPEDSSLAQTHLSLFWL